MADASGSMAALLQAALDAHGRGDLQAARDGYEAVLRQVPDHPDALHLLGVLADQQGNPGEAVALIGRAIARAPQVAVYHGNLGNALLSLKRGTEAEAAYRRALEIDPAFADGHVNLGNLLASRGDDAGAAQHYEAALGAMPRNMAAHLGLGRLLMRRRQPGEALPHLATAVKGLPSDAAARDLLGIALRLLARFPEALLQHRKAIALAPADLRYRENLAHTLAAIDTPKSNAAAIAELRAVLVLQPDRIEALTGLGDLYVRLQQPQEALEILEHARQLAPDQLEVLAYYAAALSQAGRIDEALSCCERLVALYPDNSIALSYRATTREHAGDYDGALDDYERALRATGGRKPEILADTDFKRVLLMMSLGRLGEAWPQYRTRMHVRSSDPRGAAFSARLPSWDGVVRAGQKLLVWGEQGVGDQVLFGGMLPDLLASGADVVFGCDPRLVPLFARSIPGLRIEPVGLPVDETQIGRLSSVADVQAGLGDIGAWLRADLQASPPPVAYLVPDPARVAALRAKYAAHGRRHVVGITWRSTNRRLGNLKSASLADWLPVLRRQDILFVDMQYGDTAEERQQLKQQHGIEILHDDTVDAMDDLDGYAAQAAALDLMVGCSNSGVHIAAAVGTCCWVLIPSGLGRLWYWHLGRDDSPWYPRVRLFRQPAGVANDWQSTIATVAGALRHHLQNDGAP